MAIMRVFWGMGLVPDLDALYHAICTIPSGDHLGCGVGWDWAIEMLNGAIKAHVGAHVSEAQIRNFIESWACLETVQKHMREVLEENKAEKHWRGRNVRTDIEMLVEFFRKNIGKTWAEAIKDDTTLRVVRRTAGRSRRGLCPRGASGSSSPLRRSWRSRLSTSGRRFPLRSSRRMRFCRRANAILSTRGGPGGSVSRRLRRRARSGTSARGS